MPPRTLAQILTDSFLRGQAGPRTYQRGLSYFQDGHVKKISRQNEAFTAIVSGQHDYEVSIAAGRTGLDYDCDCPMGLEGDFCKHCVAAGLAWLNAKPSSANSAKSQSAKITLADAARLLTLEPPASLAKMLLCWAEDDPRLRERLLQFAARRTGPDAAAAAARDAFEEAANPRRFVNYREAADYANRVDDAIDSFQDLLQDGHAAAVMELCEDALRTLAAAAEMVHDDGDVAELSIRLTQLHYDACAKAPPDPVQLAIRLFELELDPEIDAFRRTPEVYQEILGPAGHIVYSKLMEKPEFAAHPRADELRESLARATGDIDMLVAIFSRDLSYPFRFRQLVEVCAGAGRFDDALAWAENGMRSFPADSTLCELTANEYHRRKEHQKAMRLMWSAYQQAPGLNAYQKLREHAEKAGEWPEWRDNAIGLIRRISAERKKKGPSDHSLLVAIFLHERKTEDAWREAHAGGCAAHQWLDLAQKREKKFPGDSIPIYLRQAEEEIKLTRNGDYSNPVALLIRTAALMKSIGASAEFQKNLASLRVQYKVKRNFIKLLDSRRSHLSP